ncbi:MAG: HEAT repeat domain-containing protein [Deltaproteobacteria bacterium]|nr:HEAT repeat domain-containing protein [Deltaproteobacteria bacterium]
MKTYAAGVPEARGAVYEALSEGGVAIQQADLEAAPAAVWEAAFRGLLAMGDELKAIEVGLLAPVDSLKSRAVSTLSSRLALCVSEARATGAAGPSFEPESVALVERALVDARPEIRAEATKLAVDLNVGGSEESTLRLLLQSTYVDVRGQVLERLKGRTGERWAWSLVLALVDDPDAKLRAAAFALAGERGKGRGVQHLAWAMSGPHPNLRIIAVESLCDRRGRAVKSLLARATADSDRRVRRAAVRALEVAESDELLLEALSGGAPDVRAWAAGVLARAGDSAGLETMLEVVRKQERDEGEAAEGFVERVVVCVEGLAELEDPIAFEPISALLKSDEPVVRAAAARALAWVCDPEDPAHREVLQAAQSHEDAEVARLCAIGAAMLGEPAAADRLRALGAASPAHAFEGLEAAAAMADTSADRLLSFVDHEDPAVRARALCLRVLIEASRASASADWVRVLLSNPDRSVRITGAQAIGASVSRSDFQQYAHLLLNAQSSARPRPVVPLEATRTLSALLAFGAPRMRARAARLVGALADADVGRFTREWRRFSCRFAPEIQDASNQAVRHGTMETRRARELLSALVPDRALRLLPLTEGRSDRDGSKLLETARAVSALDQCLGPMFAIASRDQDPAVRRAASEGLSALGVDTRRLGAQGDASSEDRIRLLLAGADQAAARVRIQASTEPEPEAEPEPGASPLLVRINAKGAASPVGSEARRELQSRQGSFLLLPSPSDLVWMRRGGGSSSQPPERVVRLSGQIAARTAICDIVAFVGQSSWRGELIVLEQARTRSIFFDGGSVVGANTSVPDERIGQIMYRYGALDEAQLALVEQHARQGVRFGWAAVQLGYVTQDRLYALMGEQIKAILFATFAVDQGTFFFLDDFDEDRLVSRHTFSANGLLLDGLSQLDEMELFRRKIPGSGHTPVKQPSTAELPEGVEKIYELIDGQMSLDKLARTAGVGEYDAYKAVYALLMSKHVVLLPPRIVGGPRTLIDAANQALRVIHMRVDEIGRGDALRNSIAQIAQRDTIRVILAGAGPDATGAFDPATIESNCRGMEGPDDTESMLQRALHDYVSSALFSAEGELGPDRDRELSQGVRNMLAILRPRGDTIPPSRAPSR